MDTGLWFKLLTGQVQTLDAGKNAYANFTMRLDGRGMIQRLEGMTDSAQTLTDKALELPGQTRAEIARILLDSLDGEGDYEEEWLDLAEKRKAEMDSGKVSPVSWEDIKGSLPC